jgi:hypothetical protein
VFEGPGIEGRVRDLVDDPVRSAAFSIWAPLLEGTPVLAHEEFHWEAGQVTQACTTVGASSSLPAFRSEITRRSRLAPASGRSCMRSLPAAAALIAAVSKAL